MFLAVFGTIALVWFLALVAFGVGLTVRVMRTFFRSASVVVTAPGVITAPNPQRAIESLQ